MNYRKIYQGYDLYVNSTKVKRYYSKNKAISIAMKESANLFTGQNHVEVVDTITGEIIFNN